MSDNFLLLPSPLVGEGREARREATGVRDHSSPERRQQPCAVILIAGVIVFLLLFFLGLFAIGFSWSDSLLVSAVISIVGVGGYWWKEKVWP